MDVNRMSKMPVAASVSVSGLAKTSETIIMGGITRIEVSLSGKTVSGLSSNRVNNEKRSNRYACDSRMFPPPPPPPLSRLSIKAGRRENFHGSSKSRAALVFTREEF